MANASIRTITRLLPNSIPPYHPPSLPTPDHSLHPMHPLPTPSVLPALHLSRFISIPSSHIPFLWLFAMKWSCQLVASAVGHLGRNVVVGTYKNHSKGLHCAVYCLQKLWAVAYYMVLVFSICLKLITSETVNGRTGSRPKIWRPNNPELQCRPSKTQPLGLKARTYIALHIIISTQSPCGEEGVTDDSIQLWCEGIPHRCHIFTSLLTC